MYKIVRHYRGTILEVHIKHGDEETFCEWQESLAKLHPEDIIILYHRVMKSPTVPTGWYTMRTLGDILHRRNIDTKLQKLEDV